MRKLDANIVAKTQQSKPTNFCVFRERERQQQKQELTKRYIEEDQRMRDEWKKQEKARLEAENAEIAQFAALQKQRESERQEAKKEQEEFRTAVQSKVKQRLMSLALLLTKDVCFLSSVLLHIPMLVSRTVLTNSSASFVS